jgi:hypothetical protein
MFIGQDAVRGYAPQFDLSYPTPTTPQERGRYVGHIGVTLMQPTVREIVIGTPDGKQVKRAFNSDVTGVIEQTPTGTDIGVAFTEEVVEEAKQHPSQVTEAWLLDAAGIEHKAPEVPAQAQPTEELVDA